MAIQRFGWITCEWWQFDEIDSIGFKSNLVFCANRSVASSFWVEISLLESQFDGGEHEKCVQLNSLKSKIRESVRSAQLVFIWIFRKSNSREQVKAWFRNLATKTDKLCLFSMWLRDKLCFLLSNFTFHFPFSTYHVRLWIVWINKPKWSRKKFK